MTQRTMRRSARIYEIDGYIREFSEFILELL